MTEPVQSNSATNWPPWFESRLPSARECSPAALLTQRAKAAPDGVFVVLEDGRRCSNREVLELASLTAARLQAAGLQCGDRLLLWLPNGPEMLRFLFAAWMLGVIPVTINVALRGGPLANALRTADAPTMVCHPSLLPRLDELAAADRGVLRTCIIPGTLAQPAARSGVLGEYDFAGEMATEGDAHLNQAWDIAAIIFSSGTTGPSKGVQVPFAQLWTLGHAFYGFLRSDDRMLLVLPLFHIGALGALFGGLSAGSTFALTESFRASDFLKILRLTGGTTTPGLGRTLIDALNKTPPSDDDRDNPLRITLVQSSNPAVRSFCERFGCDVMASYSMSETSCVSISRINPTEDGSVGRARSGLEVRLVDDNDVEVAPGAAGEIIVRAALPWVLNAGYFLNPEATSKAWRNGWFHTGDLARRDAEGNLYFLDRTKDVIRRRSENISSFELEAAVRQHSDVQDVAAIGVETPEGEEVLLIVVAMPEKAIDPLQLLEFLIPRLPHFMLPRFIRSVPELPKTQTNRVQKAELRKIGLTPDAWDREAAGVRIRREKL
jgi:crotonobetaine/carnitine-CoA ligase